MVRNKSCDGDSPLCLYDFTLKAVMLDHLPLSMPDLGEEVIIEDYFYPSDEESKEPASHRTPLDWSQRSKVKAEVETPGNEV